MRLYIVGLTLLVLPAGLDAQGRAFTPADWYRVTTISAPAMSPDGKRVAVTVTTVRETENKRHSEIWVVNTDGGAPRRFTSPSTESSNPRWSPDGRYLLFNSRRANSRASTWGIRIDEPSGEAEEMERYPDGSLPGDKRFVVWSDTSIADTTIKAPADAYKDMALISRPPYGAITHPLDPKRFDGRHFIDMRIKANGRGYVPSAQQAHVYRPSQLWLQAFDGTPKRMLDSTAYSRRSPSVSPDGKWIAFIADPSLRADSVVRAEQDSIAKLPYDSKRDEAVRNDGDIFVVQVTGGMPRRLTTGNGVEHDVVWSPDGSTIAFLNAPTRVASQRIYTVPMTGGTATNILGDWQYEPDAIDYLPDGQLAFSASLGGRSAWLRLNPKTRAITEVLGGRRQLRGFTMDSLSRHVAYVATSVTRPTELFVANTDGTGETKLTGFNDALNREIAWSDAERVTYKSVGGLEIEGWLMKPYGYVAGRKYPLVLYIHGGPHGQYGENWFDEFQNLAGAGMWVLYTNPRGSSGYGGPFTYATRGRWFAEDYEDLMKGVDLASRRPDVDSTRMGVTGGSYGGVMTAWVTVKTNRFKAAQTDRMISDWWSWYGSSDAQGLTEFEFYGKPWDNPAMYDTLSPLRYIRRVKTPTLMVQSEEDFRTPMTDAEQWYVGLKKQGTPVEFVRYPRSTHDLSRTGEPWLLVDRLARLRQWFDHWLTPAGRAATSSSSSKP